MKNTLTNLVSVLGGEAAIRIVNLAAVLSMARLYGSEVLGLFGTCLAAATIVVMFADNGLQTTAVTELKKNCESVEKVAGEIYFAKFLLSIAAVGLLLAYGMCFHISRLYWVVGSVITFRTLVQSYSQLQIAFLKARDKMHWIGILQGVHAVVLATGLGVATVQQWGLLEFLLLLLACQLLELFFLSVAVRNSLGRPRWPGFHSSLRMMRKSTPLGVTFALVNLVVRLDVLVASYLFALDAVGQFSAAGNLLIVFYLVSWLFGSVLLPEMLACAGDVEKLSSLSSQWSRIAATITIPIALIGFLEGPRIVSMLYGPAFTAAGKVASVMLLACPFIALNSIQLNQTFATGARNVYLGIFLAAAIGAVLLDYGLGTKFGLTGLAAAIVAREILIYFSFLSFKSRSTSRIVETGAAASAL